MSGAIRKMGVYLGLVEGAEYDTDEHAPRSRSYERDDLRGRRDDRYDYDDAEYDDAALDEFDEIDDEPAPVVAAARPSPRRVAQESYAAEPATETFERPVAPQRITTLHPRTYNEARAIGDDFRSGSPVIMNLSEMDEADARRLVDFAAGLTFALRGSIERITSRVFLLSPQKVTVSDEEKAQIADGRYPSAL